MEARGDVFLTLSLLFPTLTCLVTLMLVTARRRPVPAPVPPTVWDIEIPAPACRRHADLKRAGGTTGCWYYVEPGTEDGCCCDESLFTLM